MSKRFDSTTDRIGDTFLPVSLKLSMKRFDSDGHEVEGFVDVEVEETAV